MCVIPSVAVKIVLSQALRDASFFIQYEHVSCGLVCSLSLSITSSLYPQLKDDTTRVWLLLFDLHMRHFEQRDPEETTRKLGLFKGADLLGGYVYHP